MCGICGVLNTGDQQSPPRELLEEMVAALHHRGPDEQAVHIDGPLGLGHARLSIIDLAGGHQPLFNEEGSVAVVCNGEIYNFRELRRDLQARGHRFRTGSDCEVLVHLWEEEGERCLARLRGMFAFVLYDRNRKVLFGARDYFGQKPLFYRQGRDSFAFASEIKGLLPLPDLSREIDTTALDQFLFYQYVPHPRTLFREVRQLPPAHYFLVENGRLRIERYWQADFAPEENLSDAAHLERVEAALTDAVESHLVSDVPVGVFLSGGIDSSLILALAAKSQQRLQTFSISFRGTEHDEGPFAQLASRHFKTDHVEIPFEPGNLAEHLETVARIFDQPLADSAALPVLALSRRAARDVKVVLTGDGGDELFGGYRKYKRAASRLAHTQWITRAAPALFATRRLAACGADPLGWRRLRSRVGMALLPAQRCTYYRRYWEGWDRHRLYVPEVSASLGHDFLAVDRPHGPDDELHPVNEMLRLDQQSYLPDDLLLKTDYSTMAHSLEARAPLLDHQLAAVAGRLPVHLKVTPRTTKVALRKIAERLLPDELAKRPKKGFSFPLKRWFRHELRDWVRSSLLDSSVATGRFFQRAHIERLLAEHTAGRRDHAGRIYCLLTFELWCRNFLR